MSTSSTPAPTPAKVAAAKKPSKKVAEKKAIEKKVTSAPSASSKPAAEKKPAAPAPEKKSAVKLPYNFRTRSLSRSFVDAVEGNAEKKEARKALREARSFKEVRNIATNLFGESEFESMVEAWFNAGEEKNKA